MKSFTRSQREDQDDQKKKAEGEGEALPLFHGGVFFSQTPFLGFVDIGLWVEIDAVQAVVSYGAFDQQEKQEAAAQNLEAEQHEKDLFSGVRFFFIVAQGNVRFKPF